MIGNSARRPERWATSRQTSVLRAVLERVLVDVENAAAHRSCPHRIVIAGGRDRGCAHLAGRAEPRLLFDVPNWPTPFRRGAPARSLKVPSAGLSFGDPGEAGLRLSSVPRPGSGQGRRRSGRAACSTPAASGPRQAPQASPRSSTLLNEGRLVHLSCGTSDEEGSARDHPGTQ